MNAAATSTPIRARHCLACLRSAVSVSDTLYSMDLIGPSCDTPPEDPTALLSMLYGELRRMARAHLARERPDHTFQPTALVHEVYLRMANHASGHAKDQFLALASRVMRQVLIDYARRRRRHNKGDFPFRVTLEENLASISPNLDLLILDEAMRDLERMDARQARIVEMRVFAGLTVDEIAAILKLSSRTVKRDWMMARAWLQLRLRHGRS